MQRFDVCFHSILEDYRRSVKEKNMELCLSSSCGCVNICMDLFYHAFILQSKGDC
jgi:hypothetical protein